MASSPIADLCDDGDFCPITALVDDFQTQVIVHLLIESAVLIRLKDDLFEQQHGINTHSSAPIVGRLEQEAGSIVELTFREACNKIIHAQRMNFDSADDPGHFNWRLQPTVYLYGEQRGKPWKATLNVVDWVRNAVNLFPA